MLETNRTRTPTVNYHVPALRGAGMGTAGVEVPAESDGYDQDFWRYRHTRPGSGIRRSRSRFLPPPTGARNIISAHDEQTSGVDVYPAPPDPAVGKTDFPQQPPLLGL